ncbi:hypothetical protein ACP70R_049376 [Stipagrostis hirtigluma subsp. patula]
MSSSSRRQRRRTPRTSKIAPSEARDWGAGLPDDVLLGVFQRLGPCCEIMRGADSVCRAWRRVAVGEPALWRRVDMTGVDPG